jgi:MinD superfamily P-loop ATPase
MKQITVISGKGGTGKTVITSSFAVLAKNKVMADCDVDAADLFLLLHPKIKQKNDFVAGKKAEVEMEECILCRQCIEVCRFSAVKEKNDEIVIDPISCEGCGVCSQVCPTEAIKMRESVSGEWFISETKYGPMVFAKLGIAEENSGKLVTLVREKAKILAEEKKLDLVIIDGPPGIGCPVIASVTGADLVMVVTEPTLSAISDLQRVLELVSHFGIEALVLINKFDINLENTERIEKFCQEKKIEILGKVPFSHDFTKAMVAGKTIVEYIDSEVVEEVKNIWDKILRKIKKC